MVSGGHPGLEQTKPYLLGVHTYLIPILIRQIKTTRKTAFLSAALEFPYGSTSARSYPVSLVFSGAYYWSRGGATVHQNKEAYWWTDSSANQTLARIMSIDQSSLYPQNGYYKEYGYPLRCVNALRLHFRA